MSDIFISYSSEDKSQVSILAHLLEEKGWSVWWDRDIPIGQHFDSVIEKELNEAKCVIVIWTERSVISEWVKNEASEAARKIKLVPVQLQEVELPLAFRRIETAQLINWQGEETHPELELLYQAIASVTEKSPSESESKTKIQDYIINGGEKKQRIKGYLAIAVIGLVVSVFAVYYYLHFISGKVNEQTDLRMFYLILIVFGVAISALIFGAMQSYASLKMEKLDAKLVLTGPAVGVLLIVLGGFYLPKPVGEKIITIRVFNKNKEPLAQGNVKLYLDEYIRSQSIDNAGQAQFAGVPARLLNKRMKIEASSPGYLTKNIDTTLKTNQPLELTLAFKDVIIISGLIKQANESPISGVEISVDGTRYFDLSKSDGSYSIRLQEYNIGDQVTLTTSHQGYADKSTTITLDAPQITSQNIFLEPVY